MSEGTVSSKPIQVDPLLTWDAYKAVVRGLFINTIDRTLSSTEGMEELTVSEG